MTVFLILPKNTSYLNQGGGKDIAEAVHSGRLRVLFGDLQGFCQSSHCATLLEWKVELLLLLII